MVSASINSVIQRLWCNNMGDILFVCLKFTSCAIVIICFCLNTYINKIDKYLVSNCLIIH